MLLLFRSVLSVLSVCRDRCRVQQSSLIGNSVNVWIYRLTFLIRRVRVNTIATYNEGAPSKCSCELDHISILLNPIINVHQRRSILRLCPFHEGRNIYPAVVGLYLQLKIRSVRTRYCTGLVSTLWISVKHIFSRKENTTANWPCLNKAFLSSLTELSNFCKCLCHS